MDTPFSRLRQHIKLSKHSTGNKEINEVFFLSINGCRKKSANFSLKYLAIELVLTIMVFLLLK